MSQSEINQLQAGYNIRRIPAPDGGIDMCLDDFVQHVAECKNSYLAKIKDKTKREGLWNKNVSVVMTDLCSKGEGVPREMENPSLNRGSIR